MAAVQPGTCLFVSAALWLHSEVSLKLVLHELHIDEASESIALAEANVSLALRAPVRPGHMCLFYHSHGRGQYPERRVDQPASAK